VPAIKSDVALLESFASEMCARRGTYGWNGGWLGDVYHAMAYAHLQPEVVFDETIVEGGLDGFRVLVMADCDVITQTMADRIKAFQANGGLIVGDERLAPAIQPDVFLKVSQRTGKADEDKAALLALAADLRKQLDPHYERYVDSSNPEIIPYRRRYRDTDYVFVVNDHREFGDYVGHHGIVMENGLPSDGVLSINRERAFAYDLVDGLSVPTSKSEGKLTMDVHLGPCDGRLFMISPRAIDRVQIEAPSTVERGDQVRCAIAVLDAKGRSLDAIIPLRVDVRDPEGRLAEFSGYHAAADGKVEISLDIARNDPFGIWEIRACELASKREAKHYVRVRPPREWPPQRKPPSEGAANAVQPQG